MASLRLCSQTAAIQDVLSGSTRIALQKFNRRNVNELVCNLLPVLLVDTVNPSSFFKFPLISCYFEMPRKTIYWSLFLNASNCCTWTRLKPSLKLHLGSPTSVSRIQAPVAIMVCINRKQDGKQQLGHRPVFQRGFSVTGSSWTW